MRFLLYHTYEKEYFLSTISIFVQLIYNSMDIQMIGILAMVVCIIFSRIIIKNATQTLDQEKKAALVDVFSGTGIFALIVGAVVLVLYFIVFKFQWVSHDIAFATMMIIILGFTITLQYFKYKELKKNDFPNSFIKPYMFGTLIGSLGLIFMLIASSSRIFKTRKHHRFEHPQTHSPAYLEKTATNDSI